MSGAIPSLAERHNSDGNEYSYTVVLEFEELENNLEFEEPVKGILKIDLSDEFPYPVEINVKGDMMAGRNDDATYAEFERLSHKINDPNNSPTEFQFKTKSALPSEKHGGKVYSFRTNKYDPEDDTPPKDNPELIEHHIGIPSSERVHLITNVVSRILNEEADSNDIQKMIDVYNQDRSSSVEKFYKDIKTYVDFESQIQVMDFLINTGDIYRDHSAVVNKVAKQVARERLRRNIESLDDVRRFVAVVNSQEGFPNITLKEVFDEVYARNSENKEELDQIAEDLDIDDWSSIYGK